jgi:4-diphosphocytidyl-2-C-methyl-D-erythritol kinase
VSSATNNAGVRLIAPAKINLALEVTARRDDGYHDIDTVMTTLDLADRITLRPSSDVSVELTGPQAGGIDASDDLAGRAARALVAAVGRSDGVAIEVEKHIPSPAGLGGGSSDAAAVLRGLTRLWRLDWAPEQLVEVAAGIGSDVPFFLTGGAARCSGRGEVIQPLPDLAPLRLLILVPPGGASEGKTAAMYGRLHPEDFTSGESSRRLAQRLARRAPPPTNDLVNVFERVVERDEPELVAHYARYRAAGAPRLHLCGSGPAAFMFVREQAQRSRLRRDFERAGATVFEARTLGQDAALAVEELDPLEQIEGGGG